MANYEWFPRQRNYQLERSKENLPAEIASNHPLKGIGVVELKHAEKRGTSNKASTPVNKNASSGDPLSTSSKSSFVDPLSASMGVSLDGSDPLSQMAAESEALAKKTRSLSLKENTGNDLLDETFEPWSAKKAGILTKYTTSEKLSITTSFLSAQDKEKAVIKAQTTATVTDKVKNRLEQLDDFEEGSVQKMLNLSQQDYVKRIDELNQALINAWEHDQRVKALKIAIQVGKLVYDRLKEKAQYYPPGSGVPVKLPDNFTPDQVPDSAKETCRNWFFKIASIRELIPRFYVEAALLKSYSFLKTGEYEEALQRLCIMTRGIGDPLVAVYCRCYLSRVGILVSPRTTGHLMPCFEDFLVSYTQLQTDSVQNILAMQKLEMPNALLLNSIISAFKPEYIAVRSMQFIEMIKECEDTGFPKHLLHRTLGLCLVMASPPEDQKLTVLNEVWKAVMKLKNPVDYIGCAEVWIEYVVMHFGKREVNTILADIIKHMTPDRAFEDFYPQLQSVVIKILSHIHDFSVLFALKEAVRVEVCKSIMEAFIKYQSEVTNDPVIINALMFICKTMHDSVNALTLEDEKKLISNLISGFINKISFGRDFEQQLSFYVECRSSFSNLDIVLVQLIQNVNNLSIETRKVVKGNHSRKTGNFVRACAAYCFITIPSLQSILTQLQLYLMSGQVALLNQCCSQVCLILYDMYFSITADAFFKAAISVIPDVPRNVELEGKTRSSEPLLTEYLYNFISTLLVVPDNPDSGVLYLLRGLLNILQNYNWEPNSDAKILIYTRVLAMLSASCQEKYIYHVDKVDSNDSMYGSDPKFINEVNSICSTLLDEILNHLKTLAQSENFRRQGILALELFNTIICHSDLEKQQLFNLATNLWGLAQKHGQIDVKQMVSIIKLIE
ncbi:hypothetical protein KUTeg_003664 [Tegillarca granosa]|uniref:VPS35 endosomal protein-sorting factor-like n=1 Tax=Tegillarca granosa TaxID=220873 RepID=A0ABQ9FMS6_TEGGR|nr:hypothetical protein KUTeg_003664 [Tegillarca granosa]